MRVFENAAQGLCLLCDEQKDLPKLELVEGQDYVGFKRIEEAVEKFIYLKKNPEVMARIALSGQTKLSKHTYTNRAIEMFKTLGLQ